MNNCNFTGRLTNDLELKTTTNGVSVCSFTLAVKRPRVKDTTDFINFTAYRQTAEYLNTYARKGALIEASGTLTSRKWEDKNGNKRTAFEVVIDNASIIESKKDKPTQAEPAAFSDTNTDDFTEVDTGDDLPF